MPKLIDRIKEHMVLSSTDICQLLNVHLAQQMVPYSATNVIMDTTSGWFHVRLEKSPIIPAGVAEEAMSKPTDTIRIFALENEKTELIRIIVKLKEEKVAIITGSEEAERRHVQELTAAAQTYEMARDTLQHQLKVANNKLDAINEILGKESWERRETCAEIGRVLNYSTPQELASYPQLEEINRRESRQKMILGWVRETFGDLPQAQLQKQRMSRFLEEAIELFQCLNRGGAGVAAAHKIVNYVFSRPVGNFPQEIGGVMVTLMAVAEALHFSVPRCELNEIQRIKETPAERFQQRNQEKLDAGL